MARSPLAAWGALLDALSPCVRCRTPRRGPLCAACKEQGARWGATPGRLSVLALGAYEEPLRGRLHALKYEERTSEARPLGRALGLLAPDGWRRVTLVPIPLHPERLAERGYNQAALLARHVSRITGRPVDFSSLVRQKETSPQARLTKEARRENAEAAFAAPGPRLPRGPVVLVDDVMTTGATLDAAAAPLLERGVVVWGALVVAIADRDLASSPARP